MAGVKIKINEVITTSYDLIVLVFRAVKETVMEILFTLQVSLS